jgi:CubicO group peptidase (beta-lactamase class C family)
MRDPLTGPRISTPKPAAMCPMTRRMGLWAGMGMGRAAAGGLAVVLAAAVGPAQAQAQAQAQVQTEAETHDRIRALDAIFAPWDRMDAPGCAVGIEGPTVGGAPILRAWGMADLEHGIPNAPATIFEAGSVAKQFTAAAAVLLEMEGVLSLDQDVRDWIPELPDYGTPVTLRRMINHTAGLRDWGSLAAIAGWGRSDRTHTHDHVLDILTRQEALNYPPGEAYSYSNSGYNLLAIVIERASGQPFADFSRDRLFAPLGLSDTQWRDDYRRIVPGRSAAYQWRPGGWAIDRPTEQVHGNGGLLTTVGDLLAWNRFLEGSRRGEAQAVPWGNPDFYARMTTQGVLTDGTEITYALGLVVDDFDGRPSVTHTGATSGYRAYLGRFPEDGLSVALLCNTGNANPGQLGGRVARGFLPEPEPTQGSTGSGAGADGGGAAGTPEASNAFSPPSGAALAAFTGTFTSHEVETTWQILVEDETLVLLRRPGIRTALRPVEEDTFQSGMGRIRFHRDPVTGEVGGLSVIQDRVWDLRFTRTVVGAEAGAGR